MIIDTHVHVVDPERFPVPAGPGYKPQEADRGTIEELTAVHAAHGVTHAVLVQLSGYGTNNEAVLAGVAAAPLTRRAMIALQESVTDIELDRYWSAGARGARFNTVNLGRLVMKQAQRLIPRIAERGWMVQIQARPAELSALAASLYKVADRVILDHLGLPNTEIREGLASVFQLGERGAYIKASGAFRLDHLRKGALDLLVGELKQVFDPDHWLWGSDWPFVAVNRRPDFRQTLATLDRWFLDPDERAKVAHGNASRVFFTHPEIESARAASHM